MRSIFSLLCLCIAFVSLYPFNFQPALVTASGVALTFSWQGMINSRGDMLGNLLLFLPYGFAAVFIARASQRIHGQLVGLVLAGAVFAFVLQLLQVALPSRTQAFSDVLWNAAGIGVGAAMAIAGQRLNLRQHGAARQIALIPVVLLTAWITYRLLPFVPSIDFQSFKNSIKPLFLTPEIKIFSVFQDMVAWLFAGFLLRQVSPAAQLDRLLWALIAGTIIAEILIVSNVVHFSGVLGAGLALALWSLWLGKQRYQATALAVLVPLALLASGLEPFIFSSAVQPFGFVPFSGVLSGNIAINIASVTQKAFLYGGFIYVLKCAGLRYRTGGCIAAVLLCGIEIAQIFGTTHTPEITDPLLALLFAYCLSVLHGKHFGGKWLGP